MRTREREREMVRTLVMKYTGISLSEAKNKTMREREMVGTFISHLVMKYTGMTLSEAKRKQRDDVTIIIMNSMVLIVHD